MSDAGLQIFWLSEKAMQARGLLKDGPHEFVAGAFSDAIGLLKQQAAVIERLTRPMDFLTAAQYLLAVDYDMGKRRFTEFEIIAIAEKHRREKE